MRVLEDPNEVSFAEALAVAAEQITGGGAGLTGAHRCATIGADCASHQIERLVASQTQAAQSDFVAGARLGHLTRRFMARRGFSFGRRKRGGFAWSATFAIAIPSPASSPSAARALARLDFLA